MFAYLRNKIYLASFYYFALIYKLIYKIIIITKNVNLLICH